MSRWFESATFVICVLDFPRRGLLPFLQNSSSLSFQNFGSSDFKRALRRLIPDYAIGRQPMFAKVVAERTRRIDAFVRILANPCKQIIVMHGTDAINCLCIFTNIRHVEISVRPIDFFGEIRQVMCRFWF